VAMIDIAASRARGSASGARSAEGAETKAGQARRGETHRGSSEAQDGGPKGGPRRNASGSASQRV